MHPTTPLPTLPTRHQAVVLALILNDFDILAAASSTTLPPLDILAISTLPEVAGYLEAARALHNARFERAALETLARLLDPPRNATPQLNHHNTESRRAATTILRHIRHNADTSRPLSPPPPRGRKPAQPEPEPAQQADNSGRQSPLDASMPHASMPLFPFNTSPDQPDGLLSPVPSPPPHPGTPSRQLPPSTTIPPHAPASRHPPGCPAVLGLQFPPPAPARRHQRGPPGA